MEDPLLPKRFALIVASCAFALPAIAQTATTTAPTTTRPAVSSPATPAPRTPVATTPQTGLVNINTASAADLDKLPQIGKARSQAIIKGRPYRNTDELVSKKILSQGVYDKIKDKITI